eukprot:TRINITY_DN9494_c0_g1_i2.p1 TRINITY_DN9494_c0_g1~~TRINITY_DN9494_c0_g1_i2.p1  ORF type:complete len:111 (+),score=11.27 TRINITY_DN9494_c0_g1_i2:124-456(+)
MAFLGDVDLADRGWYDYKATVGPLAYSILLSLAVIALGRLIWRALMRDPYPDVAGPKPEFLLCSAWDFLGEHFIYSHLKWQKTYGPVYKVRLFNNEHLVLVYTASTPLFI